MIQWAHHLSFPLQHRNPKQWTPILRVLSHVQLIHHYVTDEKGLIKRANLIVATVNNSAAINLSVKKAAMGLIKAGTQITEGLLNRIEMAWRPYDPCFGCATHNLPGRPSTELEIYDCEGKRIY